MRMILLGVPGVGKGTQAELLCRKHGWRHLATGDLLRAAVKAGTPLGKRAEAIMARGDLVDDTVILGLIEEEMERAGGEGVVLDGFPRTLAQAEGLDALLAKRGEALDRVVHGLVQGLTRVIDVDLKSYFKKEGLGSNLYY